MLAFKIHEHETPRDRASSDKGSGVEGATRTLTTTYTGVRFFYTRHSSFPKPLRMRVQYPIFISYMPSSRVRTLPSVFWLVS